LAQQDSRITAFNLPENIGTYAAKALMFRFAKGEYIVCHDADDLAAPNFIERSLGVLLRNPRKVAVISNWFRVDEELRIFPGAVRRFWPLLSINHSSLMLRTDLLKELGAWDVPRVAADTELFERIRMVYGKRAVEHLSEPLTIGSMRADSLMNDPVLGAMDKEAFRKRVEYLEAWVEWHQTCKKNRSKPTMPSPLSVDRPFYVPDVFRVDPSAISRCWDLMLSQHSEILSAD
jgi:glycosyltransferase involved in cell wall biosynthesis